MNIKIFQEKIIKNGEPQAEKVEKVVNDFIKDKDVQKIEQLIIERYIVITILYK